MFQAILSACLARGFHLQEMQELEGLGTGSGKAGNERSRCKVGTSFPSPSTR